MSSANITERSGVNAVVRYSFMETLCQLFHLHGTILCVSCVNLRIRYSNFYVSVYGTHSSIARQAGLILKSLCNSRSGRQRDWIDTRSIKGICCLLLWCLYSNCYGGGKGSLLFDNTLQNTLPQILWILPKFVFVISPVFAKIPSFPEKINK